jgi:aspartate racemase
VAPEITAASGLPLLHIGDACGAALRAAGCQRPGILGTRFTMEDRFLLDRLSQAHGLAPQVPDEASRAELHRIIFDELCCGRILDGSRERVRAMMEALAEQGCDSVVLACTEIVLLTPPQESDWPLPLFDTTALHAAAAVDWMLEETR